MNQQNFDRSKIAGADQQAGDLLEPTSRLGGAADEVKAVASEAASSVKSQLWSTLDGQVEAGAAYLGHAASSVRSASEELNKNAPALGNIAESVADKLDAYASGLQGKTADEVWADAASFTRRQPALVFGLAAIAGFLAYRTIKSSGSALSSRPADAAQEFHGA